MCGRLSALSMLCLLGQFTVGQVAAAPEAQPLFASDVPFAFTLRGPVAWVIRDDSAERREWSFQLELSSGDALDAKLRVRGNFRRKACSFPPLRVNLDKAGTDGTVFAGQDKLKLVTHCRAGRAYQLNTLQEYAAYRILNLLTDVSLRVRLARVTYADDRGETLTRDAFFIEAPESLAVRVHGTYVEPEFISRSALDPAHTTLVALFQYLIANTDFSPIAALEGRGCCHNSKLVSAGEVMFAVPYDFDMSGLVDAAYAGANPIVQNNDVRQRVYLGHCTDDRVLGHALEPFVDLRPRIDALLGSIPGYSVRQRKRDMAYLDKFFQIIEKDPEAFFRGRCRTREAL